MSAAGAAAPAAPCSAPLVSSASLDAAFSSMSTSRATPARKLCSSSPGSTSAARAGASSVVWNCAQLTVDTASAKNTDPHVAATRHCQATTSLDTALSHTAHASGDLRGRAETGMARGWIRVRRCHVWAAVARIAARREQQRDAATALDAQPPQGTLRGRPNSHGVDPPLTAHYGTHARLLTHRSRKASNSIGHCFERIRSRTACRAAGRGPRLC